MAIYIYLPVPTEEMRNFARNLRHDCPPERVLFNSHTGVAKAIVRALGGCLRALDVRDRLLVICHGDELGSRFVGADRSEHESKLYTPARLARAIDKEGLTKSFVDLRLLACGSANTPPTSDVAFADGLCQALMARGYANICVTGYKGRVSTEGGKIEVARQGSDGFRYYDADSPLSQKMYPFDRPALRASIVIENH